MMDVTTRPIDLVRSRLDVVSESEDGQLECRCPAHEDRHASLGVREGDDGRVLLFCQAGCTSDGPEPVVKAIGLEVKDLFPADPKSLDWNPFKDGREVETYPYVDEADRLLYEVVRFELADPMHPAYPDKTFRSRVPGKGWGINKHGIERVLYRLPIVRAAIEAGERVYLPEGEKDVHALEGLGVVATTNPEGAGKWKRPFTQALRGAHVVMLPDNDTAGEKHIQAVAEALIGVAASVRIVPLPGLKKKGDAFDWVAAGGTRAELERLVSETPELKAAPNGNGQAHAAQPDTAGQPYRVDGSRLWFVRDTGNGESLQPIADFEASIGKEITTENGERIYHLSGRTSEGRAFDLEIEAEAFEDERTLKRMIGAAAGATAPVRAGQTKHLAAAIKLCSHGPQRVTRYARTGWEDGRFLLPGREPEGCEIVMPSKLPYASGGDLDKGKEAFAALLEAHAPEQTTVILSHMLQAPLGRSIPGVKRAGLAIYGRTGSLKTSTVQAFLCLYGAGFLDDDMLTRFGDGATPNAIMALASYPRDLPFLVDNYKPNTGRGAGDLVGLIHKLVEGGEKDRLDRNAQLRPQREISCWPVFTGEDLPATDPAALARMLTLEMSWPAGNPNPKLTTAQNLAEHLPAIGTAWLEWLEENPPEGLGLRYAERRAKIAAYLRDRYPRMVNILRVAGNLAGNALAFEVALTCPTLRPIIEPHGEAHAAGLFDVADRMGRITAEAMEAQRFLNGLRDLIAAERVTLRHRTMPEPDSGNRGTHVGWRDAEGYYIVLEIAKKEVADLYRTDGGLNSVSNQTLCAQLAEIGAVASSSRNETTKAVRTPEGVRRCLHLNLSALEESDDA